MKTILAPIDFSDSAKRVIAEAVILARAMDASLVLFHVIPPLPANASEFGFADAIAKIAAAAVDDAVERLSNIQRQLAERHVTAATFHVTGIPGAAIVAHAEEFHASYIVIGSHGHGAFYELIVGSTASRVIKEATCPVVVVPSHTPPAEDALALDLEPASAAAAAEPLAFPAQR